MIKSPIGFDERSQMAENQKGESGGNSVGNTLFQYECSAGQFDPLQNYQAKLMYEYKKREFDLWKNSQMHEQRLAFEKRMHELKIKYQAHLAAMICTVYCNAVGDIFYSFGEPDEGKIVSHALLSVGEYKSRIYLSYYSEPKACLEITWSGSGRIVFPFDNEGINPKYFLKKLKSKGVLLLVSGRTEAKAAEALLAYSISSAENKELPYQHGWVRMSDGKWHFSMPDEMTLQEVLES